MLLAGIIKTIIRVSGLPIPILLAKIVKTKFGDTVLLEFQDKMAFLPKRIIACMKNSLELFVVNGKYCIIYEGLKEVGKSLIGMKFRFEEN